MQWELIKARKEASMTQKEVAAILGITEVTYREKELDNSEFKSSEMWALSNYFRSPIGDLFRDDSSRIANKSKSKFSERAC